MVNKKLPDSYHQANHPSLKWTSLETGLEERWMVERPPRSTSTTSYPTHCSSSASPPSQQVHGTAVVTASAATERALVSTISDQWSPSLSLTNTHANNVKLCETSTRHRAEMWTKPARCQLFLAKVALQSLQRQNICFSLLPHLECCLFEVIPLICLLKRARGILEPFRLARTFKTVESNC